MIDFFLTEERAFYCLKHFEDVDPELREKFKLKGWKTDEILSDKLSSKFDKKFTTNPFQLLELISLEKPIEIHKQSNGNTALVYEFKLYEKIGYDVLMPLYALSEQEKKLIDTENRNGFEVLILKKKKPSQTKKLVLVFKSNSNEVITIYPGIYAPPYATHVKDESEKQFSLHFWQNHVICLE